VSFCWSIKKALEASEDLIGFRYMLPLLGKL